MFNIIEFLTLVLGTANINIVAAAGVVCYFGWLVSIAVMVADGVLKSKGTPNKFEWSFFWQNNKWQLLAGLLCAASLLRFSALLIGPDKVIYVAFFLGLANVMCIKLLKFILELGMKAFAAIAKNFFGKVGNMPDDEPTSGKP